MNDVDYTAKGGSSRPQEGRSQAVQDSIDGLNSHEFNKMNRILEEHYDKTQKTILDKPFGEVINNTINFFGHSFDSYSEKLIEAETILRLQSKDNSWVTSLQKYTMALILFIRDDENIIYLGILMIILSVLICFFNISRGYENTESSGKS